MSYRHTLTSIRASLLANERAIRACEADAPSVAARRHLARARALNIAAMDMVTAALAAPYDIIDPPPTARPAAPQGMAR